MIQFDKQIENYSKQAQDYYTNKWGTNNLLVPTDYKTKKVLLAVDMIKQHYGKINKLYVCHTSNSSGLLYGLRKAFNCEVVVLTDHPLFERMHPFYNDTLGNVEYKKVRCIFDDCFEISSDGDLVIFPDMEFFIPLSLKQPPKNNKKVCCTYAIDSIVPTAFQNIAITDEEVESLFSFKKDAYIYKAKPYDGEYCYCGLGLL